jgi:ribosomal protein S18 acetylase RimI-like enzyme
MLRPMPPTALNATVRPYRNDDADWRAVRDLLVRTHGAQGPGWNWDIRRWDGMRFHREAPVIADHLAAVIGCWEDAAGRLVGAVHPEGGGDPFLELDPGWRHLEPQMLAWAEAHVARTTDARRTVELFAWDWDEPRRALLVARGYTQRASGGWLRVLRVGAWPRAVARGAADPALAAGYGLAETSEATLEVDASRMATLLNAAFGRTAHTAAEYRTFMTGAPAFRHDLNLVAVAPDGSFAAHVGVYWDPVNRHGVFEPVCTHPDHLRRGLARALVLEGARRLEALGAVTAAVDTGDMEAANAFYRSLGFHEEHRGHDWRLEVRST